MDSKRHSLTNDHTKVYVYANADFKTCINMQAQIVTQCCMQDSSPERACPWYMCRIEPTEIVGCEIFLAHIGLIDEGILPLVTLFHLTVCQYTISTDTLNEAICVKDDTHWCLSIVP